MTVKELKEKLAAFDDNLEVYLEADHAQRPYEAYSVTKETILPGKYGSGEIIHPEDFDGYDKEKLQTIVFISD